MISAAHLTRTFERGTVVDDLSFDIGRGEIFCLLGPNGAGKTTTFRMVAGLILPSSGQVRIEDVEVSRETGNQVRGRIGFLTESPGVYDRLSVETNVAVHARLFQVPNPQAAVKRVLSLFDLWDRRGDRAAILSKGLKQRLAIARALVHDPPIVLLDEPTAGLDPETSRSVRQMVLRMRDEGRAVMVSTHNLDEAERIADRVGVLQTRLLAVDTPAALRRRLFGRRVKVTVAGDPRGHLAAVSSLASRAVVDGNSVYLEVDDPAARTPEIVRALVAAGADITGVIEEKPTLEEVYLDFSDEALTREAVGALLNHHRVIALIGKEFIEQRRNLGLFLPIIVLVTVTLVIPFVIALGIPLITGEPLSDSGDFRRVIDGPLARMPGWRSLPPEARVQAFLFERFLLFFAFIPVAGGMSLASYSVIGEKQNRTLEPLLATPITTSELLIAKVVASAVPSLLIEAATVGVYLVGLAVLAAPGVLPALATPQALTMLVALGPLASLVALQLAVMVSSRVKDPRNAQQIGALVIVPLVALVGGQFGAVNPWLSASLLLLICAILCGLWILLLVWSVRIFDRETILTRWK